MKFTCPLHILFIMALLPAAAQTNAGYGREIPVTITGLTFDAMEAFISTDDNTLFFNSLNSGGNTNLYYASKLNDSTFMYKGLVGGIYDPAPDHLDAVASHDTADNFYWVSLREFPNLHKGKYLSGNVSNITKTYGDFNITVPGWIIMDAAISYQGNQLYYCNAYFGPTFSECPGVPCKARIGMALKINDSTFNKVPNTDAIFSNVNDTNYIVYAPQVIKNGLELYYTRMLKSTVNSELCLSRRESVTDTFSLPVVIHSKNGFLPEAASPGTDNLKIYYHQKRSDGLFGIYLRYRMIYTGISENRRMPSCRLYPNPASLIVEVKLNDEHIPDKITLLSLVGDQVASCTGCSSIEIGGLARGLYFVQVKAKAVLETLKLVVE